MKDLITEKHRHLLWKDELGDDFLLFKNMEVFRYSDKELGVYCLTFSSAKKIAKLAIKDSLIEFEDFSRYLVPLSTLGTVLALNKTKRRPYLKGKWLAKMEEMLAHRIIPYRPGSLN